MGMRRKAEAEGAGGSGQSQTLLYSMAWLGRTFSYQANVSLYLTLQGMSVAISGRSGRDSSFRFSSVVSFLTS